MHNHKKFTASLQLYQFCVHNSHNVTTSLLSTFLTVYWWIRNFVWVSTVWYLKNCWNINFLILKLICKYRTVNYFKKWNLYTVVEIRSFCVTYHLHTSSRQPRNCLYFWLFIWKLWFTIHFSPQNNNSSCWSSSSLDWRIQFDISYWSCPLLECLEKSRPLFCNL